MDRIVRIKDIAEVAKVSTGTVDRVLHDRGRVADEVRLRVLRIAKELNYKPNLLARALVTNKSFRIAVLIPDPSIDTYWQAPKDGIEKAEEELKQYGVMVSQFIFDPYNADSFSKTAEQLPSTTFDGILIAPIFYRQSLAFFKKWKREGIPFVLFNTHIPDFEPLMYIGQDSYQSGFLAAKLLHYGFREKGNFVVAHIGEDIQNSSHLLHKEQGFKDFFLQNSLTEQFHIQVIDFQGNSAAITGQLDDLFMAAPKTTGFFVTTSRANVIADYLHQKGIKGVSLVGYDLIDRNLFHLETGAIDFLINQNSKGQGYWGIHALADHLVFQKKSTPIKYLPLDIITKENLQYYVEADI
ncbi:LacI family DNA-binding transcriptional regulator [Rufibacter immobilis]|uniref:LacI family DNA-binding transcriptional regulator n=1 Tax=Rufibacter immobilis TaxID=1348778 RepID=UPI0035EEBDFC